MLPELRAGMQPPVRNRMQASRIVDARRAVLDDATP